MTVVKDGEAATSEDVSVTHEVLEAEDNDALDLMSDSKLPDDWSIIGSKGLDTEGSDGESVEVIPCEEEKSEAESCSAAGTSPNQLAVETREKIMQTEEIVLFRNFTMWHPRVIALSFICHLLICFIFYSANNGDLPDLRGEPLPPHTRPGLRELIEDWERMSTRSTEEKGRIINFLRNYFPLETYDEGITALLEKDMMEHSTISAFHKKRPYTPNPPPPVPVQQRAQKRIPSPLPRDPPAAQEPPKFQFKFSEPPTANSEKEQFDCSTCKTFSSACKKFCKHNKGKNLKYYYDKYIAPVVKFPNFKYKY